MSDYLHWKSWDAAAFGHCTAAQQRYFSWHLQRCGGTGVRRALEIGFGNGAFLAFARSRGIEVHGVDIEPELCARARALGVVAATRLETLPAPGAGGRYELIVAFDVFEHLPPDDLAPLLAQLRQRLADGGALLCRVPNGDSPFGRKHQHGDATHRATYGLDKLVQVAAGAGLALRAQGDAPWHCQPGCRRNPSNLARAGMQVLLEGAVRYAYRWPGLQLGPNLVAVFGHAAAPARG